MIGIISMTRSTVEEEITINDQVMSTAANYVSEGESEFSEYDNGQVLLSRNDFSVF